MTPFRIPAALAVSLFAALPVSAHVVADPAEGSANSYFRTALRVPHGCNGKPTTAVRITLPEGPLSLKPQAKAGWQVDIQTTRLDRPVDVGHGQTVDTRVSQIRWHGGQLPDSQFDDFGLTMKLPARPGDLWLQVVQECDGAELRWDQIPARGQSAHGLERPAALIRVADNKPMAHAHGMQAAKAGPIEVKAPFARATPARVGGVFMELKNTGSQPDRLIRAESAAARTVELHTHEKDGDVMRMRQIPAIDVAAQGETKLQPGGLHVMLIDLKQPLKEGEKVPLTLVFEKAGKVDLQVPVIKAGATGAGHSHH